MSFLSYPFFKSFFDRICGIFLLIAFLPLLVVALIIYFDMGSPILFRQTRAGLFGKPFVLLKFRSMLHSVDRDGNLLPDSYRLTLLGRFLRKTSIDELPALINVVFGDMSLIGPRPLLMQYLPLYSFDQARRHNVKPGFSGWAQINGRNSLSWEDRFRLDVWYVTT